MSDPAAPSPASTAPLPAPAARRPNPVARLADRMLRASGMWTSILLGLASILTAYAAYQATQYSDSANQLEAIAQQVNTDAARETQEAYAEHQLDAQIWASIIASGSTVEESPLGGMLSQRWLDALERAEAQGADVAADGTLLLPLDEGYYEELQVASAAFEEQIDAARAVAEERSAISSRITGSSIMYSAALLLLTIATAATRDTARLALNAGALAIIVVAVLLGWAPFFPLA